MKNVKITYCCDYCKKVIDQDSDTVLAIMPGRIGYRDQFIPEQNEEKIQHYHDYCLEHILALDYSTEFPEDKSLDALDKQPDEEPELMSFKEMLEPSEPEAKRVPPKKENSRKDLGKLQALLNAGRSKDWIADEFGVSKATIYNWIKELEGGQR